MGHELHMIVEMIGLLVGMVGVSIAIFLRMVSNKYCPPSYTFLFFAFGAIMVIAHSSPLFPGQNLMPVRVAGYIFLLILEIEAGRRVYKKYPVETPSVRSQLLGNRD